MINRILYEWLFHTKFIKQAMAERSFDKFQKKRPVVLDTLCLPAKYYAFIFNYIFKTYRTPLFHEKLLCNLYITIHEPRHKKTGILPMQ